MSKKYSPVSRNLNCPKCGATVRIPVVWMLGVESVFACHNCKTKFKTGFKMGAVLFALSLTASVVAANLGAYVFSSYSIPLMALLIIPLWIFFGFVSRRWWMIRKTKKGLGRRVQ